MSFFKVQIQITIDRKLEFISVMSHDMTCDIHYLTRDVTRHDTHVTSNVKGYVLQMRCH